MTVVIQGRAPRGQPSSGNVNAGAVGENGVTDERGSAATAESRLLAPVEPEVSQAELQRRREAEEKAVVRACCTYEDINHFFFFVCVVFVCHIGPLTRNQKAGSVWLYSRMLAGNHTTPPLCDQA